MATILNERPTCDGYDVRLIASDAQAYTLHFASQPSALEVDAAIADLEARLAEAQIPDREIEAEDGEIV